MIKNNSNKNVDQCYHSFRLFAYLSTAIVSIAVIVGLFLILQHLSEEDEVQQTLANQETLLQNQKLLIALNQNQTISQTTVGTILNETRRDNTAFFDILANMTKMETYEVSQIMGQALNISKENQDKLNVILEQGVRLDRDTNKKIDNIMNALQIPIE